MHSFDCFDLLLFFCFENSYHDWHEAENIFKELSSLQKLESAWRKQVNKLRMEFMEDQQALRIQNKKIRDAVLKAKKNRKESKSLHPHHQHNRHKSTIRSIHHTPSFITVGNRQVSTLRPQSNNLGKTPTSRKSHKSSFLTPIHPISAKSHKSSQTGFTSTLSPEDYLNPNGFGTFAADDDVDEEDVLIHDMDTYDSDEEDFLSHTILKNDLISMSSLWKGFIAGKNLYDTTIPATQFLYILAKMPSPVGFRNFLYSANNVNNNNNNPSLGAYNLSNHKHGNSSHSNHAHPTLANSRSASNSTSASESASQRARMTGGIGGLSGMFGLHTPQASNLTNIDGIDVADFYFDADKIRTDRVLPSDVYRRLLVFFDGLHIPIKKNPVYNGRYFNNNNQNRIFTINEQNSGASSQIADVSDPSKSRDPDAPFVQFAPGLRPKGSDAKSEKTDKSEKNVVNVSINISGMQDNAASNLRPDSAASFRSQGSHISHYSHVSHVSHVSNASHAFGADGAVESDHSRPSATPDNTPMPASNPKVPSLLLPQRGVSPMNAMNAMNGKKANVGFGGNSVESVVSVESGLSPRGFPVIESNGTLRSELTGLTELTRIRKATEVYEEWDYVVNFEDIVSAFTWRILDVDVLVNLDEDEEWIVDWFTQHWDCY